MKRLTLGFGLLCVSAVAHADVYGLVSGRTADVRSEPQLTVEAGLTLQSDQNIIGGRANFKVSPDSLIYGTIASVKPEEGSSAIAFGGGVVYQFDQSVLAGYDVAFKGSYHLYSADFGSIESDLSDLGLDLIISPKGQTTAQTGVKVFGLVGLHRLGSKASSPGGTASDNKVEPALGFGAVAPVSVGEISASVEYIDELYVGLGYRLAIGQ